MLVSLAVVLCAGSKLVLSVASCINCLRCNQLAVSRGLLFGFKYRLYIYFANAAATLFKFSVPFLK